MWRKIMSYISKCSAIFFFFQQTYFQWGFSYWSKEILLSYINPLSINWLSIVYYFSEKIWWKFSRKLIKSLISKVNSSSLFLVMQFGVVHQHYTLCPHMNSLNWTNIIRNKFFVIVGFNERWTVLIFCLRYPSGF